MVGLALRCTKTIPLILGFSCWKEGWSVEREGEHLHYMGKEIETCSSIPLSFPADDPIAIDLLRLMAAYNDLIALAEWVSADKDLADDEADKIIQIDRRFLKLRMIASFFYEAMKVLQELENEPDFKKQLVQKLSTKGLDALKRLRAVRCGKDPSIRDLLDRTRNQATFHYLKPPYTEGLSRIPSSHGPFPVVIRYEGRDKRRWYPLAEHLKLEKAFSIRKQDGDSLLETIDTITQRLDDLALVLDESCEAYKKHRNLGTNPGK